MKTKTISAEEYNIILEAATKMANALRDINNLIGEDKIVKKEFAKVEHFVEQFESY